MVPALKDIEGSFSSELGGKVLRHRIEFFGICSECLAKG
jgi:Fe2+ or Zn2+ uptake regulation protein